MGKDTPWTNYIPLAIGFGLAYSTTTVPPSPYKPSKPYKSKWDKGSKKMDGVTWKRVSGAKTRTVASIDAKIWRERNYRVRVMPSEYKPPDKQKLYDIWVTKPKKKKTKKITSAVATF